MSYFGPEAQGFLRDLHAHNEKPWFQANKARFEADVQEPALRFLEDANQWLEMAGFPYHGEPKKSGGGLSRIYRDARFSDDKTPYHTHLVMHWSHRDGSKAKLMPVLGIRLGHEDIGLGGGIYGGATGDLNKVRDAIMARGEDWDAAVAGQQLWGDQLKTAPRGYPKDHARIDAIRRKQFMLSAPLGAAFTEDLMTAFQHGATQMRPFLDFIADALS